MTIQKMMDVLRKEADVSVAVVGMLNNLVGFEVRKFIASRDVLIATNRRFTEHLDVFNTSILKILS